MSEISKTTNFEFPLLDNGGENAGAVNNGVYIDIDRLLAEARDPLSYDDELLVYEDELLLWN